MVAGQILTLKQRTALAHMDRKEGSSHPHDSNKKKQIVTNEIKLVGGGKNTLQKATYDT